MPNEAIGDDDEVQREAPKSRAVRADAQRSIEALLQAAKTVFAASGGCAGTRDRRHGRRRHRHALSQFSAALGPGGGGVPPRDRRLCRRGAHPGGRVRAGEALAKWIQRYVAFIATKRGLAKALHSGDPVFEPLPSYFEQRLHPALQGLLKSAAGAGAVRADVNAGDLLAAIASPLQLRLRRRTGPRAAHGRPAHRRTPLWRDAVVGAPRYAVPLLNHPPAAASPLRRRRGGRR